ncbi:MAG: DUF5666 domain-containing protein [Gammaproteobacteria bacterium]|nr:DUF5666 domain-containing protein [Gammaproteobacteria bacterium]
MNTKLTMVSLLVSAALVGCDAAPSANPGSTVGVITGFGSVYVNGVEYETTGSSFSIDGVDGSENDLSIGQIVTLNGTVNADGTTGTASTITFADNVEGIVISAEVAADGTGVMNVMGQTVTITADTVFDSDIATIPSIDLVIAGNLLEVSGYSQGDGTVYATHVELKAESFAGEDMEVKGLITGLDEAAKTFTLGGLLIDYASATLALEGATLANDLYVEAKSNTALSGNVMTATEVEIEGDGDIEIDVAEGDEVEISGPVLVKGSDNIVINGQTLYFTAELDEESDITFADIAVGMKLEVEAYADTQGHLVVQKVETEEEGDISITAHIDANGIDLANKTITILGYTIQTNTSTMFRDEQDEGETPVRYFNIDDLTAGDMIDVDVYMDAAGALVATKLERDDDDLTAGEFKLEGKITLVDISSFTIGGISVDLSNYPSATVGQELEVVGSYIDGVITISSVSLDI